MAEDARMNADRMLAVDRGMLGRLLFANPVCLLASSGADGARNVMTITWLTPVNNQGGFVCSINAGRHTAANIGMPDAVFALNVPVRGMEELVLAIGGSSGSTGDKLKLLGIQTCALGGGDDRNGESATDTNTSKEIDGSSKKRKLSKKDLARLDIEAAGRKCFGIQGCAAHMLCRVQKVTEDDGHLLLRCSILAGWALERYWDGRNFIPRDDRSAPYLTFLGSKVFGYVVPAAPLAPAASDNGTNIVDKLSAR